MKPNKSEVLQYSDRLQQYIDFLTGCEHVVFGALIVGVARAMLIIMDQDLGSIPFIKLFLGSALIFLPYLNNQNNAVAENTSSTITLNHEAE